jgi:hypothetical protein
MHLDHLELVVDLLELYYQRSNYMEIAEAVVVGLLVEVAGSIF